jgi:hypothetical protein
MLVFELKALENIGIISTIIEPDKISSLTFENLPISLNILIEMKTNQMKTKYASYLKNQPNFAKNA